MSEDDQASAGNPDRAKIRRATGGSPPAPDVDDAEADRLRQVGYDDSMEYLTPEELTLDPVAEQAIASMSRVRLRNQGLTDRQIDAAYGPEPKSD